VLWKLCEAIEAPDGKARSSRPLFQRQLDAMLYSHNEVERQHVPMGRDYYTGREVVIHRKHLLAHGAFLGSPESGKSSIAIPRVLLYVIAATSKRRADWLARNGYDSKFDTQHFSIVVMDLKAANRNHGLFHTVRNYALAAGMDFHALTNVLGQASDLFDPFSPEHTDGLTENQITQKAMFALGLHYGEGYGPGYFGAIQQETFLALLRCYRPKSYREFATLIADPNALAAAGVHRRNAEESMHLRNVLNRLASVNVVNRSQLLPSNHPVLQRQLSVRGLLTRPTGHYLHLCSVLEPSTSLNIAKQYLNTLVGCASLRRPGENCHVIVLLDEAAQLAEGSMAMFLEISRSLGISIFLSSQSLFQFKRDRGADMVDVIKNCTGMKQIFSANDEDTIRWMQTLSGEAVFARAAWKENHWSPFGFASDLREDGGIDIGQSMNGVIDVQEEVRPALELNELRRISAHPCANVLMLNKDTGLAQYHGRLVPLISLWPLHEAEHEELETTPWPAPEQGGLVVHDEPLSAPPPGRHKDKKRSPGMTERLLEEDRRRAMGE
jgi:hypothetical protein